MKVRGIILTIVSALLFGITPVLASQTYDMGSTPLTLTFYRNLMVIPILLAIMIAKKVDFKIPLKTLASIVLIGVLGRGVTTLTLYSSYSFIGIGTATTLHFLYPVFVAIICLVFFKEKLGAIKIAALTISVFGVAMFLNPGENAAITGIVLATASGLTYAFYMVGMEKRGLKEINPYKLSFYMASAVALAMLLYNVQAKQIVFALPPRALAYTFVIALCTSFLAVILLQLGIKQLGATTAAMFCLFEPIASTLSGWLILGERLKMGEMLGSVIILVAVMVMMLPADKIHKLLRHRNKAQNV